MKLNLYQIDAFTNRVFGGNPAAVIPLSTWLEDDLLQHIATENNLSETAFFVKNEDMYELRWFTPVAEVNLCGHATLACAFVLFEVLKQQGDNVRFSTKSGFLEVHKIENGFELNFPMDKITKTDTSNYKNLFQTTPLEAWIGKEDVLLVFESEEEVQQLEPNLVKIAATPCRGVIATAKGKEVDFVSRFFTPQLGINEDPVTGSAHTSLVPYWANVLNKTKLHAKQISKRGGELVCELKENRVCIAGQAVCFLKGEISI